MADACLACGEPVAKLCDFVLGFKAARMIPTPLMHSDAVMWRCDAPLCRRHAVHVGNIFMCGNFPGAGADTVDRCPVHADPYSKEEAGRPMLEDDATYLRQKAWTEIRRMFIRLTPPRGKVSDVLAGVHSK